jgi:LysM domain
MRQFRELFLIPLCGFPNTRRMHALARSIAPGATLLTVLLVQSSPVWAQSTQAGGGAAPGGGGGGTVTGGTPGAGVYSAPAQFPAAAGSAPQGPVGGGNTKYSSSKPISGPGDRDGFDLGPKAGDGKTLSGGENGAIFAPGGHLRGNSNARNHVVRRGDTLWEICDFYFQNPYQWPRIWSYNPQIQNPHWIYPGDNVKLREGAAGELASQPGQGNLTDRRRQVPGQTIFLQNHGFIEDEKDAVWGELNGSREDKTILTDFDEVYIQMEGDRDVKIGQELAIFRPVKSVESGKIVEIQGTVRIDQWNASTKLARGRIVESMETIERGARVGPLQRKFDVVAPLRNEGDVDAKVLTSLTPHILYGANQTVFINAGTKSGLKAGNRLFIVRKGDAYHRTLVSKSAAVRIAIESDSPAQIEKVPEAGAASLPPEFEGELRVISVRDNSALCIVLDARREIEAGDVVVGRKGY